MQRAWVDEPTAGGDDVLARREQITHVGEAARDVGLDFAHVQYDVCFCADDLVAVSRRADTHFSCAAEGSRVDARLRAVVDAHADELQVWSAQHVTKRHHARDAGRPLDHPGHAQSQTTSSRGGERNSVPEMCGGGASGSSRRPGSSSKSALKIFVLSNRAKCMPRHTWAPWPNPMCGLRSRKMSNRSGSSHRVSS